jgi:hypothetical protein
VRTPISSSVGKNEPRATLGRRPLAASGAALLDFAYDLLIKPRGRKRDLLILRAVFPLTHIFDVKPRRCCLIGLSPETER